MNKNKKMPLIGISGKAGAGKDLVGVMIQYLVHTEGIINKEYWEQFKSNSPFNQIVFSNYEIKKFADKLKDIVCLLIGCTRQQLEDQEFKNTELGVEWIKYRIMRKGYPNYYVNSEEEALREFGRYTNCRFVEVKMTPRLLLQLLGTEAGRDIIHPNIWVNALMSEYTEEYSNNSFYDNKGVFEVSEHDEIENPPEYPKWIITDTRFKNELKAIKDRGGITIRVERDVELRFPDLWKDFQNSSEEYDEWDVYLKEYGMFEIVYHESETALESVEFDYIIENNGTIEELLNKVKKILINEKII